MAELDAEPEDQRRKRDAEMDVASAESAPDEPAKKRKLNRKASSDKKFECKHEGCGKSYSRAEHLYRHQLNHSPKQIYRCDFPDCYRSFVRQDLCVRHRERHNTRGSQLQKRDSFTQAAARSRGEYSDSQASPNASKVASTSAHPLSPPGSALSASSVSQTTTGGGITPASLDRSARHSIAAIPSELTKNYYRSSSAPNHGIDGPNAAFAPPSNREAPHTVGSPSTGAAAPFSPAELPRTYGAPGSHRASIVSVTSPNLGQSLTSANSAVSPSSQILNTTSTYPLSDISGSSMMNSTAYVSQQSLQMGLPTNGYTELSAAGPVSTSLAATTGLGTLDSVSGVVAAASGGGSPTFDPMSNFAYPIFGGETYNRSPFAMADDFAAWLFSEPMSNAPLNYQSTSGVLPSYLDSLQLQNAFFVNESSYASFFTSVVPQHPMSVTSILDPGSPQAIISEDKRQELLHLITTRFSEATYSAVAKRRDTLMEGDIDDDHHVLSLRMMQAYIGSYWYHFHSQLPILHQPTFAADKTPNLLLLAVMAIGAATLDKIHGQEITEVAAQLSNFIAWHLRWEIFMDPDFRPPAKLWVFQALLLLEVYEKSFATRALHERAHIHHDTTLTLMRRGSSLIGRSSFDSPGSNRDAQSGSGSATASEFAADESWVHWIKAEATRRVAFAAFVIDSTHATMFGHSAKMVAHELRLPLPCDEALWSATSAAEVARVQSSLQANGVKPIMFLDGLKKTLSGQRVRTNAFGRTILIAGLLSVSWHMNQRDLQVSSLGRAASALGSRDKWRSSLLQAFDNWRRDFDEALAESGPATYSNMYRPRQWLDWENVADSRDVLHGLAHMASHVDIVDCQIYAGAGRLMGRFITPKDYSNAREKMTERWATKPSARDATFYALKFLSDSLLLRDSLNDSAAEEEPRPYFARDDYLLNRPWVLYFAALVVWCYGYALEGPIRFPPLLATQAAQRQDMQLFLRRVGGVRSPNELATMTGRNRCLGLLMVLRDGFVNTRWELLGEAAALLESCIAKLKPPPTCKNVP